MAFEYTPYRNPYIGTIADLMARGEDAKAKALIDVASAQARAAEAKGQIYGNAISSIGNQIGNIPAQMQANREQAFKADQQARMVRGQQREDAAESLFNAFSSAPNTVGSRFVDAPSTPATLASRNMMLNDDGTMGLRDNPSTPATLASRQMVPTITNTSKRLDVNDVKGLDLWDIEAASRQFAEQGLGVQGQKYLELMRGSNNDMEKHHESALATARADAGRLMQLGDYRSMMSQARELIPKYENNGVFSQRNLNSFKSQLDAIEKMPEANQLMALKQSLMSISGEKPTILNQGVGDIARNAQTGEVIGLGAAPPEPQRRSITDAEIEMLIAQGDPIALAVGGNREKIAKALQDGLDRRARIAAAATAGAGAATGPNSIASTVFANPSLFNGLPPALRSQIIPQLAEMGFNFNSLNNDQDGISILEAALPQLMALDPSMTQKSGLAGVVEGAAQMAMSNLRQDPVAKAYAAIASPLPVALSRASGEVGNLAIQEQKRFEPVVPTGYDPYSIRQAKYAAIEAFIAIARTRSAGGSLSAEAIKQRNKKAADELYNKLLEISNQVPKQDSNPFPKT